MKTFIEKLKDFLYDSIDYLIIIAIIVCVVALIGWRLDVLFAKDTLEATPPPTVTDENKPDDRDDYIVDGGTDLPSNPQDKDEEASDDIVDNQSDDGIVDNPDSSDFDSSSIGSVTVTIPDGTLPSAIGSILESNELVTSKNDFVIQAQSLGLDRRLRSGTYEIPSNSSLDEIIRIIAHQN